MCLVSNSTFKWMKPVKINTIHHYAIVLVSLSWMQINYITTHKYRPVNDEINEQRCKCNYLKIVTELIQIMWDPYSKYSSSSLWQALKMFRNLEAFYLTYEHVSLSLKCGLEKVCATVQDYQFILSEKKLPENWCSC